MVETNSVETNSVETEIINVSYEATSTEVALNKKHAIEPHLRIDSMVEVYNSLVKRIEELEASRGPFRVQSEQQDEFRKALAKAQSETNAANKVGNHGQFKTGYATLESCWEAIREPLANNDIGIIFEPRLDQDGNHVLIAEVIHFKSGQYRSYTNMVYPDPKMTSKSMALKSGVTSAERLFLISMFGLE